MKFFTNPLPSAAIASSAVVGAAYAALTIFLLPISYGAVQFRLSEALNILPFFMPSTAWGLFVGCAIANMMSAAGLPDIIFGSLATLLSALCVSRLGRRWRSGGQASPDLGSCIAACAMPVVFNGPIIGAVLAYAFTPDNFWAGFFTMGAQVAAGEAAVMLALGLPLMRVLINMPFIKKTA